MDAIRDVRTAQRASEAAPNGSNGVCNVPSIKLVLLAVVCGRLFFCIAHTLVRVCIANRPTDRGNEL